MAVNVDVTISGRVIEIHYKMMVVAHKDKDGRATTTNIYGDDLSEFRVGDLIHYTEKSTIRRLTSDD